MKVLVLNAGSSSQKSCLYHIDGPQSLRAKRPPKPLWEAQIDWRPEENAARVQVKTHTQKKHVETVPVVSRGKTLSYLLNLLHTGSTQVIAGLADIDIVGHRVVHGGQEYQGSVVVTADVKATIARLSALAPDHNPANLEGIELMEKRLPGVTQVAVFDTAFHSQLPEVAAIYPGPYDWVDQGIRRYGFHGISHRYCTHRAAEILVHSVNELRLIICHLGNGASLAAVKNGQSIDTTMGFTPLDGLMMGTRSGAIDPGILIHLVGQGLSADGLDRLLNKDSGLKGISGVSHDFREIGKAITRGNKRARLARDIYLHRLKACLGAMLMSLGGVDAIVFTAGVGEHQAWLRAAACQAMEFLGVQLDPEKNESSPVDQDIARAASAVRVLVIHTQEDWAIAQECYRHFTGGVPVGPG